MIAVLIPAYNAERFLPEAIASVRAQGGIPHEIWVIDDGSTDGTAAVAAALGTDIRVLRQSNQGAATARNAGVRATSAECIAFLDADDLWPAGRLELLRGYFAADPTLLLAVGRTQLVVGSAASGAPWHAPLFGSALFRRTAFHVVGEIDPVMQPAEDLDWFIRARERAVPTAIVHDTTLLYRQHGASLTSGADPARRNMFAVLKRSLDRRRKGSSAPVARLGGGWLPEDPGGTG